MLQDNLKVINENIKFSVKNSTLACDNPSLIAVVKNRSDSNVELLIENGILHFADSYLQEHLQRKPSLKEKQDIKWHFIGQIQTNKLQKIVENFDVIHSISSIKIIDFILNLRDKGININNKKFLLQFNLTNKDTQCGILFDEIDDVITYARSNDFPVCGFMCIGENNSNNPTIYAYMQKLKRRYNIDDLSMGMSNDYQTAVRFGASMLRIGSALFN